jgi:transcription antitermination factor NusG
VNPGSSWFAVQTRPKCEKSVAAALEMKGYESFYPIYKERRQWSDRRVELERPLFPGYVFCRLTSAAFGKALLTSGVTRMVGFGLTPSEIPDDQIDALRRVNTSDAKRAPWTYIPTGTRIRVESGPLQGLEGIYLPQSDDRRLILSVDLLQGSVAVILAPEVAYQVIAPTQIAAHSADLH